MALAGWDAVIWDTGWGVVWLSVALGGCWRVDGWGGVIRCWGVAWRCGVVRQCGGSSSVVDGGCGGGGGGGRGVVVMVHFSVPLGLHLCVWREKI